MLASTVKLSGRSLIGSRQAAGSGEPHYATDPTTGERSRTRVFSAHRRRHRTRRSTRQRTLFRFTAELPARERAAFLRRIAENIEAIAPDIVERAGKETALPQARLQE